jgi:transposase
VTRVEIVARGEVRREYTAEERAQILTEAAMPGARVLVVAQRYGVSPSLVYRWRREAAGRPVRKFPRRGSSFVPLLVEGGSLARAPTVSSALAGRDRDSDADRVEVLLRNGRVLRIGGTADPESVARLAAALEA